MAMRSPGLTSAPAIAKFIGEEVKKYNSDIKEKSDFNPYRERITHYADLSPQEWEEEIEKDSRAGNLVCFCNKVTEKEIVEAIRRGATTVDSIKFRTRAMFGSCQGGFCTHRIVKILARELGKDISEITLRGEKTVLLDEEVRK